MKNYDIARILERIADMLEIKGENPYKVQAYRKVADLIDGLTEDVEQIARRDELLNLPGVGQAISAKIKEIVQTGTTSLYEQLKKEVPEGLLEMLELPGIGPDKVRKIYRGLGIVTIDELEAAAREGKLRTAAGIAEKTEQRVLEAIDKHRRRSPRIPLFRALPYWQAIASGLSAVPGLERIEAAGSFRRRVDTIGDLNVVAVAHRPGALMEALAGLPQIARVLDSSPERMRAMTNIKLQVELRTTETENWGAVLQQATGSRAHNLQLIEIAKERGLVLDQSGLRDAATGKPHPAGAAEESLYEVLGLPWLPPEIREGKGEVEAALAGRLPRLISLGDIRGDFHVHSIASDGRNTILEMADAARSLGYEYVGIADHSKRLAMVHGLNSEELLGQVQKIRAINEGLEGFRILASAEVDILPDGSLDYSDDVLAQLDVVIASVHSGFNQSEDEMTARVLSAVRNPNVDIIGHPTGRILGEREPYRVNLDAVLEEAAKCRTALEISAYPDRLDLSDENAWRAKEAGVKLAIDTDSHATEHLELMHFGVSTALRAWLEPKDVLNTMPLGELTEYLRIG